MRASHLSNTAPLAGGRVAVAMSGGVDSSVAAALLRDQGYDVVGFSMQLWDRRRNPSGEGEGPGRCCSIEDIHDARSVASRLGIPYYVVNLEAEFEREVVRPFIEGYARGLTPSPCVLCNSRIKFERLVRMADGIGATHVATGHYARVEQDPVTGRRALFKGRDASKDQSYFLFELTQAQLAQALFPLGQMTKMEVREIARRRGLEVAEKPDSQEICFVPDGDYAGFVERSLDHASCDGLERAFVPGEIVDRTGSLLGRHAGIHRYTVGQRRGLGIAHREPLYVVEIRPEKGEVVVAEKRDAGRARLLLEHPNWVAGGAPREPVRVEAKIRSRHLAARATVSPAIHGSLIVEFDEPQIGVAPGQACVFYDGDRVLGGGWIAREPHPSASA